MSLEENLNIRISKKDKVLYDLYQEYLESQLQLKVSFSSWVRNLLYAHITLDKEFRLFLKNHNINISF